MNDSLYATENERLERVGLRLSAVGALGMAALGISFSLVTHSQAVLLDGLFSLIGFAVSLVTMRVATLVRRPDDERFHFGYAAYEPMLNLSKGLLIAMVTVFALAAAVDAILRGGREVRGGSAAVYAVVAMAGCLVIAAVQHRIARRTGSPLLDVDTRNWLVDGMISGAVAVAFLAVVLLEGTRFAGWLPYADPVVVVALAILSAPIPLRIIRENWAQLLGRAPDQDLQREARTRVYDALSGVPGVTPHLRMLETGRTFYLQVYLVIDPASGPQRLADLDELRARIHRAVTKDTPDIGLDVIFTREPRWAGAANPAGSDRNAATDRGA